MNQKISTGFGLGILFIVALAIGYLVWMAEKSIEPVVVTPQMSVTKDMPKTDIAIPPTNDIQLTPPENNDIAGEKLYENKKYGFKIRYPSNLTVFQGTDQSVGKTIPITSESKTVYVTDNPEMFFCCEPTYFYIEVLDSQVDDFPQWIKDTNLVNNDNRYRVKSEGYITFAGERAYQLLTESGIDSPGNIILVNHKSRTYYITDNSGGELGDIASSFTFTR